MAQTDQTARDGHGGISWLQRGLRIICAIVPHIAATAAPNGTAAAAAPTDQRAYFYDFAAELFRWLAVVWRSGREAAETEKTSAATCLGALAAEARSGQRQEENNGKQLNRQ